MGVRRAQGVGSFIAGLVVILWTPSGAADEPPTYELDEVLEKARQYAPLRAETEAAKDVALAQQSRAHRARLPRVKTQSLLAPVPANADPSRIDANIDEITGFQIGPFFQQTARLVIPVYTFGRISTAQELSALGVDVASLQAQQAVDEHLLQTRRAFYGHQLSTAFGEVLSEGRELVGETLEQMEEERAFGEAEFETEDLRRLQIFDAEIEAMALENDRLRDLTLAALRYLTDKDDDFRVPPLEPGDADLPLQDLATYQELARSHRPEVRMLHHGVEARRLEEELARREFYPQIFFAGDFRFGWSTEDPALQPVCRRLAPDEPCIDDNTLFARPYANPFDTLTLGIGLGLRWDFHLGDLRGRYREAQARHTEVDARRRRALAGLELEIEESWRRAHDARERIDIEARRFEAARRWRDQVGLAADLGRDDDMEEMIEPLSHFYEAKISYLEAVHNYLVARAELARAVGVERLRDIDHGEH